MEIQQNEREKLANFYVELLELDNLDSLELKVNLTREQINDWGKGLAVLALAPIEFNWELAFERLLAVAKVCQKWQTGPQQLTEKNIEDLESLEAHQRKELVNSLIRVDGQNNQWAKTLGISTELLDFLSINTFRPALKTFSQHILTKLPAGEWEQAHCPVCGDQPTMSKLSGKEGLRKLYCSRCETEWRYKRIGCPYCKNDDVPSMYYLTLEDNKQYRCICAITVKATLKQ
ncbi:hypothetical protein N752_15685 [Desulforamulus aquiferis]|nr:formate dehydrogenase accessory protein FdhE [Desulforamulus aquiferis]RYD04283.1 hypothetical protein N752_15685 [Desulforamulus aquiferis]